MTEDDDVRELKHKAKKHAQLNILQSPEIDNDPYRKKYKNFEKRRNYFCLLEELQGTSNLAVGYGLAVTGA